MNTFHSTKTGKLLVILACNGLHAPSNPDPTEPRWFEPKLKGARMTSSFASRIKSSPATLFATLALVLAIPACSKKVEPENTPTTAKMNAQTIPANEGAQSGNPHGGTATGGMHGVGAIPNTPHAGGTRNPHTNIPTRTRPDLSKMPNDAVHAPYRNAPQMGPHGRARPGARPPVETDGHPSLPLVKTGPRSIKELTERLALEKNEQLKEKLEKGFRLTFSTKKNRQTAMEAATVLAGIETGTGGATANRILAYVSIVTGGGFKRSQEQYAKAVELDPTYGAAHYGLAFSLLWSPTPEIKALGRKHFDKAMELGVEDTNNLRGRFYTGKK